MNNDENLLDMGFTSDKFPVATHMCLIYNSEEERQAVLTKFLRKGIDSKEKVMYVADDISKSKINSWLIEMGINLNDLPTNFNVFEAEGVFCSGGYFTPEKMINGLKEKHDQTKKDGYCCMRASGEMTWATHGVPGSERLIEYESKLNYLMETHPFLALCQYDARAFDGKTIFEILQVHPYMIVKRQIVKNPYYIKPDEFLKMKNLK